jgi:hypothetical protein
MRKYLTVGKPAAAKSNALPHTSPDMQPRENPNLRLLHGSPHVAVSNSARAEILRLRQESELRMRIETWSEQHSHRVW